jgi:hypothetical protein
MGRVLSSMPEEGRLLLAIVKEIGGIESLSQRSLQK